MTAVRGFVLALVLLLAVTGGALASHHANRRTRASLHHVVKHSKLVPPPVRHGHFRLLNVVVSTKGPWARATIQPTGKYRRQLDSVLALFKRTHRHWRLNVLGTAEVGCDHPRLSRQVRRDLRLSCP